MAKSFELFAFHSNLELTKEGFNAGVDGVVIDLEFSGKENRQSLYNTQITKHHLSHLVELRNHFKHQRIICRVNGGEYLNEEELNAVLEAGASEILVPMVTTLNQVDFVFETLPKSVDISFMIETNEAVELTEALNEYPIRRLFVGLNDLSIARKQKNIFLPLVDGTIDLIRSKTNHNLGVGGLTHPSLGSPIPCQMLINEMLRLDCGFGFFRRSYYADLNMFSQQEIVSDVRRALNKAHVSESHSKDFKAAIENASRVLI